MAVRPAMAAARRLHLTRQHVSGGDDVSTSTASAASTASPIASTSHGPLLGRLHPSGAPPLADAPFSAPGTVSFLGVPYCEQPVPPRRFQQVEPLHETWTEPRRCLAKPPIAPQPLAPQLADTVRAPSLGPELLEKGELPPGQSEACCYLSVYHPAAPQTDGNPRPVLVWFHGGGMTFGSTKLLDGSRLAIHTDTIVVGASFQPTCTCFSTVWVIFISVLPDVWRVSSIRYHDFLRPGLTLGGNGYGIQPCSTEWVRSAFSSRRTASPTLASLTRSRRSNGSPRRSLKASAATLIM